MKFSQFNLFLSQETVGEQQAGSVWNSNRPSRADTPTKYNRPGQKSGPSTLYSVSLIGFNCLKIWVYFAVNCNRQGSRRGWKDV